MQPTWLLRCTINNYETFILILFLFPSLAFGAYPEFYCQSGGSNLNAGTTNNNTPVYTSIHGNWVQSTGVFTPTDSSTPASSVSAGMRASVYIDGATVGVFNGEISAVGAGTNGTITANTRGAGAKPANQTGTASIVVGGAMLGPNGASGFPFTLASWGSAVDSSAHPHRTNLKNDQTYSLTASFAFSTAGNAGVVQGYSSSVGDGGKATFDGGTSTAVIITDVGIANAAFIDCIFSTSFTSGSSDLFTTTRSAAFRRCVFTGARGNGVVAAANSVLVQCEAYGNNQSNTSGKGGFQAAGIATFIRCISHDNTTANASGFVVPSSILTNCIADTNGGHGIAVSSSSSCSNHRHRKL